jgi:hypothetical protein
MGVRQAFGVLLDFYGVPLLPFFTIGIPSTAAQNPLPASATGNACIKYFCPSKRASDKLLQILLVNALS